MSDRILKPLVILESPWESGKQPNPLYLRFCLLDSLKRGESPYASHRLYTDALNDSIEADRRLGMEAGFSWIRVADFSAAYVDLGITRGMQAGMKLALDSGKIVEERNLLPSLVELIKESTVNMQIAIELFDWKGPTS